MSTQTQWVPAGPTDKQFLIRQTDAQALSQVYAANPKAFASVPRGAYITGYSPYNVQYSMTNPDAVMAVNYWNQQNAGTVNLVTSQIPSNAQNIQIVEKPFVGPMPTGMPRPPPIYEASYTMPQEEPTSESVADVIPEPPPKSVTENILGIGEQLPSGGLLGLIGLGSKPQTGPLQLYGVPQPKENPLAPVAGVTASVESLAYGMPRLAVSVSTSYMGTATGGNKQLAGIAGVSQNVLPIATSRLPVPPATLTGELTASAIALKPTQGLEYIAKNPKYALGSLTGDILISLGLGKAIDYFKGPTATKIRSISEIEKQVQAAPDEYITTKLTKIKTEQVSISRADAAKFRELEEFTTPKTVELAGVEKTILKGGDARAVGLSPFEESRSAIPVLEAVNTKPNIVKNITGIPGKTIDSISDVTQEVTENIVQTQNLKGLPTIYGKTTVKGSGEIIGPSLKLSERNITGIQITRESKIDMGDDLFRKLFGERTATAPKTPVGPMKPFDPEAGGRAIADSFKAGQAQAQKGVNLKDYVEITKRSGAMPAGTNEFFRSGQAATTIVKQSQAAKVATDIISVSAPKSSGTGTAAAAIARTITGSTTRQTATQRQTQSSVARVISVPTQRAAMPRPISLTETEPQTQTRFRMPTFENPIVHIEESESQATAPKTPSFTTPRTPVIRTPIYTPPTQTTITHKPVTIEGTKPIIRTTTGTTPITFNPTKITPKTTPQTQQKTTPALSIPTIARVSPILKMPKLPNWPRGGGNSRTRSEGFNYGAWSKRKHPVKTYSDMLKTFGIGSGKKAAFKMPKANMSQFKIPNLGGKRKRKR